MTCKYSDCSSLQSITIPNSVTNIEGNPFVDCEKLVNIECQSNHFVVRDHALYTADMTRIISYLGKDSTFVIPDTITHIGCGAFSNCKSLQSIIIPNSVIDIATFTFYGCNPIRTINIPPSVTHIGESAFGGMDSLQSVTISDSVTKIDDYAFMRCKSLQTVIMPSSITQIGEYIFFECESLKEIIVPKGTKEKFVKLLYDKKDQIVEK